MLSPRRQFIDSERRVSTQVTEHSTRKESINCMLQEHTKSSARGRGDSGPKIIFVLS